jgi:hypothetical protein
MKNAVLVFRSTANRQSRTGLRQTGAAFPSSKTIGVLLAVAVFLAAAQTGISTIASATQISLQVLVQVCRFACAVLQIFGK